MYVHVHVDIIYIHCTIMNYMLKVKHIYQTIIMYYVYICSSMWIHLYLGLCDNRDRSIIA